MTINAALEFEFVTNQQKFIIATLAFIVIVIFALMGLFAVVLIRTSRPNALAVQAAVTEQPISAPQPVPSATPSAPPPATITPAETAPPTPTSTRVVTQTVLPTPSPTPANCLDDITNFQASGVITNEEIRNFLSETLPHHHLDNCQGIRYVAQTSSVHSVPATGRFTPLFRQISVYRTPTDFQSREIILATLVHEVGHNIHHNIRIDDWDMAVRWTELNQASLGQFNVEGLGFVSDYARTNEYEDFAETYRVYVYQPEVLLFYNPDKYEYMRQVVFAGREYNP